ncbi:MAG: DUF2199 domain-containing protein [Patescibacteria group bacterium]
MNEKSKSTVFRYTCVTCGKVHEGAPSFSFLGPVQYSKSKNFLSNIFFRRYLNNDFCSNGQDFMIRVVLEIPILGFEEPFTWGVWVSQKKENFDFYRRHFSEDLRGRETFGWLCNKLPYYADTLNLKTMVMFRYNHLRPLIRIEKTEHELSQDFYNGITLKKAQKIGSIANHMFETGK